MTTFAANAPSRAVVLVGGRLAVGRARRAVVLAGPVQTLRVMTCGTSGGEANTPRITRRSRADQSIKNSLIASPVDRCRRAGVRVLLQPDSARPRHQLIVGKTASHDGLTAVTSHGQTRSVARTGRMNFASRGCPFWLDRRRTRQQHGQNNPRDRRSGHHRRWGRTLRIAPSRSSRQDSTCRYAQWRGHGSSSP